MRTLTTLSLLAVFAATPLAWAQDTPVGLWKSIDDASGKPTALIRITDTGGELQGRIEKLFRTPEEDQNPRCALCQGDRKDQPITGMTILNGLKRDGNNEYAGGEILDPKNGKVYKSKLMVREGGRKLEVRGYIGMPMLGRSQVWLRQE
jgi:uncharacterized protein (DUF2147 family)